MRKNSPSSEWQLQGKHGAFLLLSDVFRESFLSLKIHFPEVALAHYLRPNHSTSTGGQRRDSFFWSGRIRSQRSAVPGLFKEHGNL